MVVKLHLPSPFTLVICVPPAEQATYFAARQQNECAKVAIVGPPVLAHDRSPGDGKSSHRELRTFATQGFAAGQRNVMFRPE